MLNYLTISREEPDTLNLIQRYHNIKALAKTNTKYNNHNKNPEAKCKKWCDYISNWIDHLWDLNKSYSPALSSNNKKIVHSVVLQWYAPQRKTPHMRLPFNTSLYLYGNTRDCVRTQIARGDRPRDIHHLQGGILLCQHVRAQGHNSSCFPSPGRRVKKGGGYLASKPFIMFFPKQLLCKQTWLLVGKSVISTLDLSSTSPLWLHRFNHPSCHSSEAASHGGGFLWEL